ncbi:hypothetical protein GB937_009017 [Aspergillus fischeri]|nr:hypothetical protein GB937_009017 [Aspergillus fischeri]
MENSDHPQRNIAVPSLDHPLQFEVPELSRQMTELYCPRDEARHHAFGREVVWWLRQKRKVLIDLKSTITARRQSIRPFVICSINITFQGPFPTPAIWLRGIHRTRRTRKVKPWIDVFS